MTGGGQSLNFKVLAYATEEALKAATPGKNTIGIITTTAISEWSFSAKTPPSPKAGMVWFSVGTSSDFVFNALKKNTIEVYPVSANQYVNGSWTDVTCFTYLDGKWKSWISETYVYNTGNQCSSVSGGWKTVNGESETAKLASGKITFTVGSGSGRSASVFTKSKVDVSKYKTMVVTGKIVTQDISEDGESLTIGLTSSNTATSPSYTSKKVINNKGNFSESLDISKQSSSYYICLYAHASDVEVYTVLLR
jgi:hypothetical protein